MDSCCFTVRGFPFPGIPESAQLVYAEGRAPCPAPGDPVAFLDGGEYGGTAHLFDLAKVDGVADMQARVVGIEATLSSFGRNAVVTAFVPPLCLPYF